MSMNAIDVGIITIVPREVAAVHAALGIADGSDPTMVSHSAYWLSALRSKRSKVPLRVASTFVVGASGNAESAITAAAFLRDWRPRLLCLVGIAAGLRGRVKIGDVVVPSQILDTTAGVRRPSGVQPRRRNFTRDAQIDTILKLRPLPKVVPLGTLSSTIDHPAMVKHAVSLGLSDGDISTSPRILDGSLVSTNYLIRDAAFLQSVFENQDERLRGGEMEAAGFCRACELERVPWIIFRGIADFGDERKDDEFQSYAALAAACAMREALCESIDVSLLPTPDPARFSAAAFPRSVEDEIKAAFIAKRWSFVVDAGKLLSRSLWLSGLWDLRLRINTWVAEAAARVGDTRARGAALVDGGWTLFALGDREAAKTWVQDGLVHSRSAVDAEQCAKAYRHLASFARREGHISDARSCLEKADIEATLIEDTKLRGSMQASLLLSRAKLDVAENNAQHALFRLKQRPIGATDSIWFKIHAIQGKAYDRLGERSKAESEYRAGYGQSIALKRGDEAYENAAALFQLKLEAGDADAAFSWAVAALQDTPPLYDRALVEQLRAYVYQRLER